MFDFSPKLIDSARNVVLIILVVLIAWSLQESVLFFMFPPEEKLSKLPSGLGTNNGVDVVSIDHVTSLNLFGDASQAQSNSAVTVTEALAETRLNLELIGVFAASAGDPEDSAALISEKRGAAKLFRINERVPGNATLVEVFADRVVLERSGKRELLRFPTTKSNFTPQGVSAQTNNDPALSRSLTASDGSRIAGASSNATRVERAETDRGATTGRNAQQSVRQVIASYQGRLENDAEGTLAELGIKPISTEAARGYRLGSLASHPALRQTGLQPGDILLSVNNRAIGNVAEDRLEFENVLAQGSARLEIKRGSRNFFITVSLK
ncbi:MAG: type II secretion system protein N [Pseudomonadales bacterium]